MTSKQPQSIKKVTSLIAYDCRIVVHATLLPSVSAKTASVYRFDKVYRLKPTVSITLLN